MSKTPDIVSVSDFRQDAAALLKRLQAGAGPMVVTLHGRAVAVMQSADAYGKHEREMEQLRLFATGEREVATGKGHSLVSVMKGPDPLLGDKEE